MAMASTPDVANASTNRISPFGSGINKNLLTPCRRVGLSRKRRTPLSVEKVSSDLNDSAKSIYDSSLIQTTPVNHRKSFGRRKNGLLKCHSSPLTIPCTDSTERELKTDVETLQEVNDSEFKNLFERFASEDLFDSSRDIPNEGKESLKSNSIMNLKQKLSIDESLSTTESIEEKGKSILELSLDVMRNKVSKKIPRRLSDDDFISSENTHGNVSVKIVKSDKLKVESIVSENEVIINDSDEDFIPIDKCNSKRKQKKMEDIKNTKKTKRIKKVHSMNKSSLSITDDEFDTVVSKKIVSSDNVKVCKVQIPRLSENEICLIENTNISDKVLEKSVKEPVVAIINDDEDDDDAFTFTPEQEKHEKKNLVKKIKALESQVKQKQQKLANLQQASIYKHKHDVGDLKQLTSQWINGCVLGLNDLLAQLQAHGPMSMTTLVNNLHVPSEIIVRLPLNLE